MHDTAPPPDAGNTDDRPPRLLVVAHGTASAAGAATTASVVESVRAARPGIAVDLCFLDVVEPRLPDAVDARPTILVPLLLSTGFHVQTDIPAAVAAHPNVRVAAHLGPDPLVIEAVLDRIGIERSGVLAGSTVLVAAGSSRPEAADECLRAADLLQAHMSALVHGHTTMVATMADDLEAVLAAQAEPFQVATYLLAEGTFVDRVRRAAAGRGVIGDPIGPHPALIRLVWQRYDETRGLR